MNRCLVVLGAVMLVLLLVGCGNSYKYTSYYGGAVTCETHITEGLNMDDDVAVFRFNKKGTYVVSFFVPKGMSLIGDIPRGFTVVVDDPPQEKSVIARRLNEHMGVSIKKDNEEPENRYLAVR